VRNLRAGTHPLPTSYYTYYKLAQFRVLRLGLLEDGDVGVGVSLGERLTAAGPYGGGGRRNANPRFEPVAHGSGTR